ncbi:Mrp/NBP35 family ATP-binding protein [Halobellus clavatus]|jgi:ATP-binding protein involved in chromosome partitioning|uniref:Iron-sulfur cluster carrier protein n=1 Tax=Halobellus clavatus TaxID=660517 RepID=A0A1H3GLV4_9EURY|nr:Mrp/NBP35 family ATP-binding protein [Halobellus clavatus]SDY04050.1 ATP-binding protein involved in chromosome partitioning [Halobellus clavatus]
MNVEAVRERLSAVSDPDLGDDIVSLGLVNAIDVDDDAGVVRISLALGAPFSPAESAIADSVRDALSDTGYDVDLSARIASPISPDEDVLPGVQNVIAVASGKGGVGKSTVAVNLAAGLSKLGARVGLFDADVYGPNVPRMVDAEQAPQATGDDTIVPPEQYGMKLMSMAFLVGDDDPVIWRGPMVHKLLTQLVEDVQWGELDYLVLDLPPGTGDTQLTVLQTLPLTGAVIVTTPQDVAVDDARKGLEMFGKHDTDVLGIVENMSTFRCPDCGSNHDIFGAGGGKAFAAENDLPFLGALPLDPDVRTGGDGGEPVVLEAGETADAFRVMTENVADMAGVVRRREASRQSQ